MSIHAVYRTLCISVAAVLLLGVAITQAADVSAQPTNEVFTLKLTDGSLIICKPKLDVLKFDTAFGEMKIPIERLENLKINHKESVVTLSLLNGDKLQGRCLLEGITVESILGELKIPFVSIAEIVTTIKKEPVYEDSPAKRNVCMNNLRMIDAAKEQWAMAEHKSDGDAVDIGGANAYIKGNRTPVCPAGGTYNYDLIGEIPSCSVPGHSFPE